MGGGWVSNDNLIQYAVNDLRNEAAALGANYVSAGPAQLGQQDGTTTTATITGVAYMCPPGAEQGAVAAAPATAAAAPPAPTYDWPPPTGRVYDHFDEFERLTVVQADMTASQRVLRIFGAPRRSIDSLYLDVVFPGAAAPAPECSEVLVLFGEEVSHFPVAGRTTGVAGEPTVRVEVPLPVLERGLGATTVKYRYCGADWEFTSEQVVTLRSFVSRFREVATREPPGPPPPAGSAAPATAGSPRER